MQRAIFVSYPRDDAEGEAGRLYDDLARAFGPESVFIDVAGIAPGLDFRKAIEDNVAASGVFLALIGPRWADMTGSHGHRRLEDPNDLVRIEIVSALARNIPVIPVLLRNAVMPSAEHLPQSLRDLAYRNAFQISHARWNMDLEILVRTLRPYVNSAAAASFKTSFLQRLQILSRLPLLRFRMTWTVALLFAIIVFSGFYLKLRKPSTQVAGTNQIPTLMPPSMKDPSSGITGIPNHIPDSEQIASRKYSEMLLAAQHLVWPVPVAGDMRGTWENKKPSAFCNAVDKVELTGQFGTTDPVMIHAWGRCGKKSIDWGESTIRVYQGRTECDYNFDTGSLDQQSRVTLTFVLASGGLFVNSDNTIYQSPTPFPDQEQFLFTKISGPRVARASRDKIDWR